MKMATQVRRVSRSAIPKARVRFAAHQIRRVVSIATTSSPFLILLN